jgi:hypothetical protein
VNAVPFKVYLEAAARTQELLTAKWTLRSCGYIIGSTWHDQPLVSASNQESHCSRQRLDEMKSCDALAIVRGPEKDLPIDIAVALGFAAARNLRVICIGEPVDLPVVAHTQYFCSLDEFRKEHEYLLGNSELLIAA